MRGPLVSLIITTKNEEKNIPTLLKSIKKQSYKKVEIIVVDNNSIDKTKEIARRYTTKVFNKGPERSFQRNLGAGKAKGKYLLILDADMELTKDVIKSCLETIRESKDKALIVPERTVGDNFLAKVRSFERDMYVGDPTIELARFFERRVFDEYGGYDVNLTGAEDYDLPKRISEKYSIGWSKEYILHHEEGLTLKRQVRKKYYYASKSASYADKHPELIAKQGILIYRRAYIRHWTRFIRHPILGGALLFLRSLETVVAVSGYISAVGLVKFGQTFLRMLRTR